MFITGAARGIGADTARRLHDRGANVSLVGLEPERLAALAESLGGRAAYFHADVTDPDALADAVAGTVSAFGGIDVVIANAGVAPPVTTTAAIAVDDFERIVDINLMGVWRTVKATLPHIKESGGHVVLIASIYAFLNGALNASYAVSKAGVEQLGRALGVELAPSGATVGVAYFGFIDTDMVQGAFAQPAAGLLRKAFPGFITRPVSVDQATDALVTGIECRSSSITAPRWVRPAKFARGPLALLDHRLGRDAVVHQAIAIAESGRQPAAAKKGSRS